MPDQDIPYPGWPEFEYVCDSARSGSHGPAFCGLGPGPDCPWCQRKVVMTPGWEAFIQDTPNRHQRRVEALLGNSEIKASLRRHSRYNRGESQERMMNAIDSTDIRSTDGTPSTNIDQDVAALLANIRRSQDEMTSYDLKIEAITQKILDDLAKDQERVAAITRTGQKELRRMQRRLFWQFVGDIMRNTVREYFSPITRWFTRKR